MPAVDVPGPDAVPSRRERRLVHGALLVLLWTAFALAQVASQLAAAGPVSAWLPPLGYHLWSRESFALSWAAFTPLVLAFLRRVPLRSARALAAHVAAAGLVPTGVVALAYVIFNLGRGTLFDPTLPFLREMKETIALYHVHEVLTYVELLAVAWAVTAARRAGAEELRTARLASQLGSARLASLRTQLHPHFLFNTLNMLLPLISDRPDEAERLLVKLGELFRVTLRATETLWPLRAELDFLSGYLDIQRARFGPRLTAAILCDAEAEEGAVPPLVLQPLVENAIAHGIAPRPGAGRVDVRARRDGPSLVLEVVDDGLGLRRDEDRRPGAGTGLANTRTRLTQLFGGGDRLVVSECLGGGVSVRIEIPFLRLEEAPAA